MTVHPSVLRGFRRAAEAYERARPTYPNDAVAWLVDRLGIGPGRTVVDLAAGTGKLTRLLVPTGARVIAIEPVDEMRAQLEAAVPGAEAVAGFESALLEQMGYAVAALIDFAERQRLVPVLQRDGVSASDEGKIKEIGQIHVNGC